MREKSSYVQGMRPNLLASVPFIILSLLHEVMNILQFDKGNQEECHWNGYKITALILAEVSNCSETEVCSSHLKSFFIFEQMTSNYNFSKIISKSYTRIRIPRTFCSTVLLFLSIISVVASSSLHHLRHPSIVSAALLSLPRRCRHRHRHPLSTHLLR
ncbi:hypothetical protein Droror1_Dr00002042 [Drosera rotundifolia]